jgi:Recombination endonuclease VII/NUMOD3 motif
VKCEPGCTCSKHDVCRKVGKSNLGRTLTPEHRAKIGRNPSAETRRKISDAQGGPSLCGRKVSYEYKTAVMMTKPDVCDLCNGPQQGQQSLTLDHDHVTGELRGWLCTRCNTGLGKLGDDVEGLRRALAYIEGAPSAPLVKAAAMCESSPGCQPAADRSLCQRAGRASVST